MLSRIGIEIEWRVKCADGHPQVGGGAFVTARDWAKFGEFMRLQGRHDNEQLVTRELVTDCFKGTKQNPAYGQTWWLRSSVTPEVRRKITILSLEWADVANAEWLPDDLIAAVGAGKQRLYVIPSRKLVIVRQGSLPSRDYADTEFLSLLLHGQSE